MNTVLRPNIHTLNVGGLPASLFGWPVMNGLAGPGSSCRGLARVSVPGTCGEILCWASLQAGCPAAEPVAFGTRVSFVPSIFQKRI